jgi:NAD(P)H dehydrogenase (quinone)
VNMSQISAREDAKSHAASNHWFSERVFDWSGLTVAHIRPTFFAEWLLQLAPQIREGTLHVPFGTGRHAPITAEDRGRVIAGILEDPAPHKGKIYPLFGPVEYSYREMAQVLSRVLGKNIEYEQVSFEAFAEFRLGGAPKTGTPRPSGASAGDFDRAAKRAKGNPYLFQHLREVAIDHQNGIFAGTNDNVEKLGGRPPMTLEAFITKNRAAFV